MSRHANAFSSLVGFGSCWFFCSLLLLAVSPRTWLGGAWVPGGPCPGFVVFDSTIQDISSCICKHSASHVSPVSPAQWASPQFESICTNFLYSILEDEPTGLGYMNQRPASKKMVVWLSVNVCIGATAMSDGMNSRKQQCSSRVHFTKKIWSLHSAYGTGPESHSSSSVRSPAFHPPGI